MDWPTLALVWRRSSPSSWHDCREDERRAHCDDSEGTAALRALVEGAFGLDASGAPLDPSNTSYRLVEKGCDVDLDVRSTVLRK